MKQLPAAAGKWYSFGVMYQDILSKTSRGLFVPLCLLLLVLIQPKGGLAQVQNGKQFYNEIKALKFDSKSYQVSGFKLRHQMVEIELTGTVTFAAPVDGKITAAVFRGNGTFTGTENESRFEKANLKRLTGMDSFETSFKTAVFRFSEDVHAVFPKSATEAASPAGASSLAKAHESRVLEETGLNLSSRIAVSLLNGENAGFFFATFEGGKMGRFSFLFDPLARTPTAYFGIDGGEKSLIFAYEKAINSNDVLLAYYGKSDYEKRTVSYSDVFDLIDIRHYGMDIDLRNPSKELRLNTRITATARFNSTRAIPFSIGESLGERENQRLKKQMRVSSVRVGGSDVDFVQEDWESGFTVFLTNELAAGNPVEIEMELAGDYLRQPPNFRKNSYPRSNSTWYPRHGVLDRSTYDFRYKHAKRRKVASVGERISEREIEDGGYMETVYEMKNPIALATFALGPFERHTETIKWDDGSEPTNLEFNSLPGEYVVLKEDFVLAELNNSVRYFHALFGAYPYKTFSATYHPFGFGQGFPSMLMIPGTDRSTTNTFSFVSHETAHQWWGNIVSWRSYRDQWLSEGFAEYSGVLYTDLRKKGKGSSDLLRYMRRSLEAKPNTLTGVGKGTVNDVGPIILGRRLHSSKSLGAYSQLVYNKGALVLRMIHFLLSDPNSNDDKVFIEMMKDFVDTYRDKAASTDDFRMIVNKHFAKTPIAKKYRVDNLNWFFAQYVYETNMPSYELQYYFEDQQDGSVRVKGQILQKNVDKEWFMAVPIVFDFGGKQKASGTIPALGPKTPFSVRLPKRPKKVEVDPYYWILAKSRSEKKIKATKP